MSHPFAAQADAAFQDGTCFVHVDGGDDGSVAAETLRRLRDQPSRVQVGLWASRGCPSPSGRQSPPKLDAALAARERHSVRLRAAKDRRDDLEAAAAAKRAGAGARATRARDRARRAEAPVAAAAWLRLAALGARCRVAGNEMEADRKLALDPFWSDDDDDSSDAPSRPRGDAPKDAAEPPGQPGAGAAPAGHAPAAAPHLVFTEAATKIKRWWIAERYRRFARELGARASSGSRARCGATSRIHHRYKLAKRAVSADVVAEFLRGAAVSGKYAIRRMQQAVRCFQRVARTGSRAATRAGTG
ncbi:solute carrier family protein [Aureococcus anophagefferens]|uniref:Solute carrier family protein n=1 Tax=Aureococcus anophagefferens TaxID=44056 RepID=A0ABR1FKI7_AURAN